MGTQKGIGVGMIIALDAGHYNDTPGKRCLKSIDPKETRERFLNTRMAEHVEELLKEYDCKVMRCDDRTGKTDPSLSERAARANRAGAGVFVSIHHNAGVNGGNGGGICVFAAENASKTSLALQKAIYDETVNRTGLKGNRATPLPISNFTVIYKANMPAVLGEFGFMDSTTDVPIILTDDFSQKCAKGIVAALVKTFGIKKKSEQEEEMVRYRSINDVPEGYRAETKELMDLGFKGYSDERGLYVTEDMLRCMIVNLRMCKALIKAVPEIDEKALLEEFKKNLTLEITVK